MPGRTFQSTAYAYSINGQIKDTDIDPTGSHTSALYWEYDSRTGRRWNTDPVVQPHLSPYATFDNNPILLSDVLGNTTESTGVRDNKDGSYTVVGAKNDGDNNVYIADAKGNWDKNSKVIAQTLRPYDFMMTNDHDGTFKNDSKFGKDGELSFSLDKLKFDATVYPDRNTEYSIRNVALDRLKECGAEIVDRAAPDHGNASYDKALVLALYSRNNKCLDFKTSFKMHKYTPILVNVHGKSNVPIITSLRAASNIVFGSTLAHTNSKTILPNTAYYKTTMPAIGAYNQWQNSGNDYNQDYPYYGEHTFSGSFIYFGYFGNFYK